MAVQAFVPELLFMENKIGLKGLVDKALMLLENCV